MKADILELETSPHQKVQKLLPWAAQEALQEAERVMVQLHVAECAQCQADLDFQRRLAGIGPAPGAAPDMERALGALQSRLDEFVARPGQRFGPAANWLRWAVAAQLAVIFGLGWQLNRQQDDYRLLGAHSAAQANMIVVFRPDLPEARLRTLLQQQGARVVDGPTAANAWLLAVPPARLATAAAALRQDGAASLAEALQEPVK